MQEDINIHTSINQTWLTSLIYVLYASQVLFRTQDTDFTTFTLTNTWCFCGWPKSKSPSLISVVPIISPLMCADKPSTPSRYAIHKHPGKWTPHSTVHASYGYSCLSGVGLLPPLHSWRGRSQWCRLLSLRTSSHQSVISGRLCRPPGSQARLHSRDQNRIWLHNKAVSSRLKVTENGVRYPLHKYIKWTPYLF